MDEGDDTLEQILSKDISKSQLGEAKLTKYQNVTELQPWPSDFQKSGTLAIDQQAHTAPYKKEEKGIHQV